jgi:hypothetical protein
MFIDLMCNADTREYVYITKTVYHLNMTTFFWVITQRVVAIPYRGFETTYRSHLQAKAEP